MALFGGAQQKFGTHSFTIVTHTQSELLIVITDLDLDLLSLCVQKSIAQGLGSDFVDFITNDRVQVSRLPFNGCEFSASLRNGGCSPLAPI